MVFPNLRLLTDLYINAIIFVSSAKVYVVHVKQSYRGMFIAEILGNRFVYLIDDTAIHTEHHGGKVYKFLHYRLREAYPISATVHTITEYQSAHKLPINQEMLDTMKLLVKMNVNDTTNLQLTDVIKTIPKDGVNPQIKQMLQHLADNNVQEIPKERNAVVLAAENNRASKINLDIGFSAMIAILINNGHKIAKLANREKVPRFSIMITGFLGFIASFVTGTAIWWLTK